MMMESSMVKMDSLLTLLKVLILMGMESLMIKMMMMTEIMF